jgi:hypothetical protein
MFRSRSLQDVVLKAIARDLKSLGGEWKVVGTGIVGPGTTGVELSWAHNENTPEHIDIGFVLDVGARPREIVWDCVVGSGKTQQAALERAARTWVETTVPPLLEMLTKRQTFATNLAPGDPEGLPGFHVIHGPVMTWGVGDVEALQQWVVDNGVLPALTDTLVPRLGGGLNAIKLIFGGVLGEEMAEVTVNGIVQPDPGTALLALGWPRSEHRAFARMFVLAHR